MVNICLTIANVSRVGGEERMCAILANGLASRGYKVIIVSQNNYYWQKVFFHTETCVKKYSMKRTLFDWLVCRIWKNKEFDIRKYHRILLKNHIDLVIDVDTELSLVSSKVLLGSGIRHISWEHFCFERFFEREISTTIINCLVSNVDKLVVLTRTDYYHFVNDAGIPPSKICQISNPSPIEAETFIQHYEKKVLSMGRLENEKGIDTLLRIWSIVEPRTPDWILEIVGEGSHKQRLQDMANSMDLKRVVFSGFCKCPEDKYRSASVFVLPSRQEGFSLALVEAGNMGLPMVSFDCPNGPREIIHNGENGILIPPGDIDAFASSLMELINNVELRDKMGRNAYESMDRFRLNNILNEWENLISSLFS